jgi:glycosyltransferase involved in cell wall biosynthesis
MAARLPVVASRAGGIPALVRDGETGLLAAPDHVMELTRALLRVLGDDALRERMGRAAGASAQAFDPSQVAARTLEVYHSMIGEAADAGVVRAGRRLPARDRQPALARSAPAAGTGTGS